MKLEFETEKDKKLHAVHVRTYSAFDIDAFGIGAFGVLLVLLFIFICASISDLYCPLNGIGQLTCNTKYTTTKC